MPESLSLVSIIIPLYNRENLIKETLKSVIVQTYPNWECIVVDDGSTDSSFEAAFAISEQDSRIKVYKREANQQPKGAPLCRNLGVSYSQGDFLIFLDSDDLLTPNALSLRVNFFEKYPEADFIVFPTGLFKKKVGDTQQLWNIIDKPDYSDLYRFFNRDTPWCITSPTWKKESFLKLVGFQEDLLSGQDWELHVKAIILKLNYVKAKLEQNYIDNYVRRSDLENISGHFYQEKHVRSRMNMFCNILSIMHIYEPNEIEKRSIIKHFFRLAIQIQDNSNNLSLALEALGIPRKYKYMSWGGFILLSARVILYPFKIAFINKILDSFLFKFYQLDYLLIPQDVTRGVEIAISDTANRM